MKVILVSVGNFQDYILDNIRNLLLFGNQDISVLTNRNFFPLFEEFPRLDLVDCENLSDFGFDAHSQLDKSFRNGFWHFCSLRLFYVYSFMKTFGHTECIHLENDNMVYIDLEILRPCFKDKNIYATFDCENRVIPGVMYLPDPHSLDPIIQNYSYSLNDMENLTRFRSIISPLPIFPFYDQKWTCRFKEFHVLFDAAAMGQYLGGVDPRNIPGDTRGFVNETCEIKYNEFSFEWIQLENNLYAPHLIVGNFIYRIINLHLHCKNLKPFMADNPTETLFIPKQGRPLVDKPVLGIPYIIDK